MLSARHHQLIPTSQSKMYTLHQSNNQKLKCPRWNEKIFIQKHIRYSAGEIPFRLLSCRCVLKAWELLQLTRIWIQACLTNESYQMSWILGSILVQHFLFCNCLLQRNFVLGMLHFCPLVNWVCFISYALHNGNITISNPIIKMGVPHMYLCLAVMHTFRRSYGTNT